MAGTSGDWSRASPGLETPTPSSRLSCLSTRGAVLPGRAPVLVASSIAGCRFSKERRDLPLLVESDATSGHSVGFLLLLAFLDTRQDDRQSQHSDCKDDQDAQRAAQRMATLRAGLESFLAAL